jgi:hypothetical protein
MKKNSTKKSLSTALPVILYQAKGDRPRAALFQPDEIKKAKELAVANSLSAIEVCSTELRKVASRLPRGNLATAGIEAVPATTIPLYNELLAARTATLINQGKIEPKMAASWDAIKAGDLVIAQHTRADGWYEAVVLHVAGPAGNEMFHLKWLDYPRDPLFIRHRKAIALTSVAPSAKAA